MRRSAAQTARFICERPSDALKRKGIPTFDTCASTVDVAQVERPQSLPSLIGLTGQRSRAEAGAKEIEAIEVSAALSFHLAQESLTAARLKRICNVFKPGFLKERRESESQGRNEESYLKR